MEANDGNSARRAQNERGRKVNGREEAEEEEEEEEEEEGEESKHVKRNEALERFLQSGGSCRYDLLTRL